MSVLGELLASFQNRLQCDEKLPDRVTLTSAEWRQLLDELGNPGWGDDSIHVHGVWLMKEKPLCVGSEN